LSFGRVDPTRGGGCPRSLRRNLALHHGELRFQRSHRGMGLIQAKLIGLRVDLEEHLALLDLLVVEHVELDDAAAHLRGQIDDVGLNGGVVGAWPFVRAAGDKHPRDDDARQRDEGDKKAKQSAERQQHRSMTVHQ